MFRRQQELRGRRRGAVVNIGIVAIFGANMDDLLPIDAEQGRHQRGAFNRRNAGRMDETKIAHVFAGCGA